MKAGISFQSLLVLGAATAAIAGFYGVSHTVASERQALTQARADLVRTNGDIRRLKTELGTRASLRQLERWNAEVLGLQVPVAGQFVTDAGALASLDRDGIKPGLPGAPPMMVEAMRRDDEPGQTVVASAADAVVAAISPAPRPVASDRRVDVSVTRSVAARQRERSAMLSDERARPRTVALARPTPRVTAPVTPAGKVRPRPSALAQGAAPVSSEGRAERLAAMESRLADAVASR